MREYEYPFEKDGKVYCQVCGKLFGSISPAHVKKHNLTFKEYQIKFPDAPILSEVFRNRSKYGNEDTLFVQKELEKINKEVTVEEIDDIPEHDVEPVIENSVDTNIRETSSDICVSSKNQILDHLRTFFINVRKDFMIQEWTLGGTMLFEFITDFADPVLKIDIEFPNTFWHNRMSYIDPNRDIKLEDRGWKIIKINSQNPTFEIIRNKINRLELTFNQD